MLKKLLIVLVFATVFFGAFTVQASAMNGNPIVHQSIGTGGTWVTGTIQTTVVGAPIKR